VPITPQSTHLTIVTTCSCSTHPRSHLSTSTPLLIAFSSPSCHFHFKPQPSPHNLTEGHFCSQWLFPLHSPHFLLSTFPTYCTSAFLGRAALFGQPHRTCPTFHIPNTLLAALFPCRGTPQSLLLSFCTPYLARCHKPLPSPSILSLFFYFSFTLLFYL